MPLPPGEYKATITVPPSGGLGGAYTTDQVQAAILAGFAALGMTTPTVEVR